MIVTGYLSYYHWEYIDAESGYTDYVDLYKRKNDLYFVKVTQGILGLKKKSLKEYFQDCPTLAAKSGNREIKSPIEVVNYYNSWNEENPLFNNSLFNLKN